MSMYLQSAIIFFEYNKYKGKQGKKLQKLRFSTNFLTNQIDSVTLLVSPKTVTKLHKCNYFMIFFNNGLLQNSHKGEVVSKIQFRST